MENKNLNIDSNTKEIIKNNSPMIPTTHPTSIRSEQKIIKENDTSLKVINYYMTMTDKQYLHFAKDILSNDEMNEEAFWIMIDLLYTITNMLGSVWQRNNEHLSAEIVMELEKDQSEQVASDYYLRMHSLDYIPNKLLEDGFSLK